MSQLRTGFKPSKQAAEVSPVTPEDVCRILARMKSGPTEAKRAEWIGKVLDLAEHARRILKEGGAE